jgi:hypothetical protein
MEPASLDFWGARKDLLTIHAQKVSTSSVIKQVRLSAYMGD